MPKRRTSTARWVAGVDGCQAGWVVVLRDGQTGNYYARVASNFRSVLTLPEAPAVITVDMPIGLLESSTAGGRACEVLARQLLGTRHPCVFSAPARSALAAFRGGGGYQAVSEANRGGAATAPGLSKQAFGILPKIDEVDAALSHADQSIVREVHPRMILLFGSQARGNAGPDSDWDFLIISEGDPLESRRQSPGAVV